MKERPILFSGPMVRAIIEGRKTQTRRAVKLGKNCTFGATGNGRFHDYDWDRAEVRNHSLLELISGGETKIPLLHVPFCNKADGWEDDPADDTVDRLRPIWEPGDLLWVRETWASIRLEYNFEVTYALDAIIDLNGSKPGPGGHGYSDAGVGPVKEKIVYRADGDPYESAEERGFKWRPSIHMPRWASRLTLEVVSVRVERLQDISIEDAIAEGVFQDFDPPDGHGFRSEARNLYRELWDSLAKLGEKWADNPWVWVIEFKPVEVAK